MRRKMICSFHSFTATLKFATRVRVFAMRIGLYPNGSEMGRGMGALPRKGAGTRPALYGAVRKLPHPAAKVAGHILQLPCLCTRGRQRASLF